MMSRLEDNQLTHIDTDTQSVCTDNNRLLPNNQIQSINQSINQNENRIQYTILTTQSPCKNSRQSQI